MSFLPYKMCCQKFFDISSSFLALMVGSEPSAYSRLQSWVLETKLAHGNGSLTLCFHYAPWTEIESSW